MKLPLLAFAAASLFTVSGASSEPTPDAVRNGLARATAFIRSISAEGGYLWWYSEDLTERAGEGTASPTQVWVQSPGTPSVGKAFLRAFETTGDRRYLEAAEAAAMALVRGQLESGGWDYRIEFDPDERKRWNYRTDKDRRKDGDSDGRNVTTFDDDNTQGALRFLMAYLRVIEKEGIARPRSAEIRDAVAYGLAKMIEAQYPNGGWPQRYDGAPRDPSLYPVIPATLPERYPREHEGEDYRGRYTLNDQAQNDCIATMLMAASQFDRTEYLETAKKGGDFLILAQLPRPQAAWAQQYNRRMAPAWARAFEPPSISSAESAGALRTLVSLYKATGDAKYLAPGPGAISWFERSKIGPDRWARFYELRTNRPIYGDRDGKIHYDLEEISEERRNGYAWQGGFGVASAIRQFEEAARLASGGKRTEPDAQEKLNGRRSASAFADAAARALASLDEEGRWIRNGRIETRQFIRNAEALCDYLDASE